MKWFLKLIAWIGSKAHAKFSKIEEREARANALTPGTLVVLSRCPCPYDNSGVWRIDEYMHDAGDYRIIRQGDGARDYARREVMELVQT